jgi:Flp pilus assembly protein TadG
MSCQKTKSISSRPIIATGSFVKREEGAIAVMFALMLGALVTIMAMFFDLGRAYNLHTELQTAVDAAALAGATQLDGGLGARVSAANAAASSLPQNSHLFGNVDGAGVVTYSTTFACVTDASNPPPCVMANANFEFYVDDAFTLPFKRKMIPRRNT